MRRFALLLVVPLALMATHGFAAAPAEDLKNEIIYRVNLGRADDVKILFNQGASPNQANDEGVPLLCLAAARKDKETVSVMSALLDAGADINGHDKTGQTALFYAAREGNKDAVEFLMKHSINLYAPDASGNTARTIAHDAGHEDIVEFMDNFVREQTANINKQYDENNKLLQQRYEQERAAVQAAQQKLQQQAEETAKKQKEIEAQSADTAAKQKEIDALAAETGKQKEALQAQADQLAKERAELTTKIAAANAPPPKNSDAVMKGLIFHNCAFQYWSYVRNTAQSSELSADELRVAIQSHKEQIQAISQVLTGQYKLPEQDVNAASEGAKKHIFHQLDSMPSKNYRHEKGVGRMDDMQSRCEDIAEGLDDINDSSIPVNGGGGGNTGGAASQNKGGNAQPAQPPQRQKKPKPPPAQPPQPAPDDSGAGNSFTP